MEAIRDINNDAFSGNPWFLPLSKEEYDFSGKFMFLVTSPKLISIIEFKNKPVGVVQCVYNINRILNCLKGNSGVKGLPKFFYRRSNLNEVVIYAAGVKKEFRNTITSCLIFNEL